MTPNFWRGRRVLLTGHTGFKGGWLALWLSMLGARVSGLALAPVAGGLFATCGLERSLQSRIGDIRDAAVVRDALRASDPEVIFHLAAQPLVRESYADPLATFATNVMGTAHVLDAARLHGSVQSIVVVTTDKCYRNEDWSWGYRETDHLGGADPYSGSKACAELLAATYRTAYFGASGGHPARVATARAGNVIGGGDWCKDRLVPDLVRSIAESRRPEIRSPSAVRPWQFVLEPLRGYLMLAERLSGPDGAAFAEAWNFGPMDDEVRTVEWVVRRFLSHWSDDGGWVPQAGLHPHEARWLKLDSSKARAQLGWTPALALSEALEATAGWYRGARQESDMRAFSERQIDDYAARVARRVAERTT